MTAHDFVKQIVGSSVIFVPLMLLTHGVAGEEIDWPSALGINALIACVFVIVIAIAAMLVRCLASKDLT